MKKIMRLAKTSPIEISLIICRRATLKDLADVIRMDGTDDHMSRKPVGSTARLQGKVLGGDVFLALENDRVVGYARYDMLWPESVPLLAWLYVEPAYRTQGVSDTLRSYSFGSLAEEGFKAVLRSACTHRPAMISKLIRECGPEAGRLRFEDGAEEVFFWQPVTSPRDHPPVVRTNS